MSEIVRQQRQQSVVTAKNVKLKPKLNAIVWHSRRKLQWNGLLKMTVYVKK
jgi:hypothetical protein